MKVEVTNISQHGFWVFVNNKEYFLSFKEFPWFKERTVSEISRVELLGVDHLFWEDIDVDLTLEMIEFPERFPFKARSA